MREEDELEAGAIGSIADLDQLESGVERDVVFGEASVAAHTAIDAACHAKYDRYGCGPVGHVTGASSQAVTIRLVRSEP